MNDNYIVEFILGKKLSEADITSINASKFREWNSPPLKHFLNDQFGILRDKQGNIVAHTQLYPISTIIFDNLHYSALGISSVISEHKHQGHGLILMQGVQNYLKKTKQIGIGFTGDNVIEFFHKAGFQFSDAIISRFITEIDNKKVNFVSPNLRYVFYYDPEEVLFSKIIANPQKNVFIPQLPTMKRLYLTSQTEFVARNIADHIGNVENLKLVFITTATETKKGPLGWLNRDREALTKADFQITDYTITGKTSNQIKKDLFAFDIIYMAGGNPIYLMQKIKETNSAQIFRELILEKGKIYIGQSAGTIVASQDLSAATRPEYFQEPGVLPKSNLSGLGLIDFNILPHWGDPHHHDKFFNYRLEHIYTEKDKIILLTDNQYIRVEGDMFKIEEVR